MPRVKADKKALEKILLNIGGNIAKIPNDEPDFYNLLSRGYLINKPSDIIELGEMCQCHKNSVLLWKDNKKKYKIMTGYALSSSGTWHQHSWLLYGDKTIETTAKREKYYGYIMTPLEAEMFLAQYIHLEDKSG